MQKFKKLKNLNAFKTFQTNEFYKMDISRNFIKMLCTMTEHKGGIGSLSKLTKTKREHSYTVLAEAGRLVIIIDIINALNLKLIIRKNKKVNDKKENS